MGDSHEMPNSKHPLLFSQSCQAKLGFKKDVRDGTITMKDYDDQNLEVARQIRTGLFMIRIDHLDPQMFADSSQPLSKLLLPTQAYPKPLVSPGQEEEADQVRSPTPERADLDPHA